jgi:hypothetical protein
LRFGNGDAITLEAWVFPDSLKEGGYTYIVGKGRTAAGSKNQNYALRLHAKKGQGHISFLFASDKGDFHRWTSSTGFAPGGWHHVAVSYTFGDPKSLHGFIDGKSVTGTWDMAGATALAPVNDDDHLQIGTGHGGGAGNLFSGLVDNVAVWRTAIPDAVLSARYQAVAVPPKVAKSKIPPGQVLVQLCEKGLPEKNAWPDLPPESTEEYTETAFGFFDVPKVYADDGVPGQRPNPFLLRASASVNWPAGQHRLLLRGRGASRLYIDGKLVLSTPFPPNDTSGHGSLKKPESYLNLGPDFRFAPPGNREATATITVAGGEHLVVLETIVGGHLGKSSHRRPELGETVAAISLSGTVDWHLIGHAKVPYTDAGWAKYHAERAAHYDSINAARRQSARADHEAYWKKRREATDTWLKSVPPVAVPAASPGMPANNAIDHFLNATIAKALKEKTAKGTVDYFKQVQPILETKCYGCHAGDNAKGKLKLDHLEGALAGGRSDGPAITPGNLKDSAILPRIKSSDEADMMPPKGDRLTAKEIAILEKWIAEGAHWPALNAEHTTITPLTDDYAFLRRVYLDVVGVPPTPTEIDAFLKDRNREAVIDRLLADPRWADNWMGYWQDVLAENPNILNPTLNNTGPFRWWLYDALKDNLSADRFVTQLLRMRGSERYGGPAGFAIASQNDVPFAAKGTIISAAFMGVEMKCARCHDAPGHRSTQEDLFQLAAMLGGKPLTLPVTSTVSAEKLGEGGRKPLIKVSLKPGTAVKPAWPFARFTPEEAANLAEYPEDSRDRLAALITAPQNERFAQVMANRLWKQLMGRGIVEPVDDWEKGKPSHPELLQWLGRELAKNNYDLKALSKTILMSHAYQRVIDPLQKETGVLFAAPARRRLPAEAIVDSLFAAAGKPFQLEEVSLDIDGIREEKQSLTLGIPSRAWMLTSTSNERDRPSLSLPRLQPVTDVLAAYGWRGSRQDPTSARDQSPNVLQPAILANGIMGLWLTRLSDDHAFTQIALEAKSPEAIVDELFLRIFTRKPTEAEKAKLVEYLKAGFETRLVPHSELPPAKRQPKVYISWSNHLDPKANELKAAEELKLRDGDPPTTRLNPEWRKRLENVLWAAINSPEAIHRP